MNANAPTTPRKQPAALRQAQILHAALAVMAERGYDATTMDGIAALAGLSKGALYYHYESKAALFAAALSYWHDQYNAAQDAMVARESDPAARLEAYAMAYAAFTAATADMPPDLPYELWVQAARLPETRAALAESFRASEQRLLALVRGAVDAGRFAVDDPDAYVITLIAALNGLFLPGLFDTVDLSTAAVVEQIIATLIRPYIRHIRKDPT